MSCDVELAHQGWNEAGQGNGRKERMEESWMGAETSGQMKTGREGAAEEQTREHKELHRAKRFSSAEGKVLI